MKHLEELRKRGDEDIEVRRFLKQAEKIVAEKPVSVMDRKKTYAPDPHYYCSLSRYSWPSEKNSKLYVIKDGKTNPEMYDYNRPTIEKLSDRLKELSVAFFIGGESVFYDKFCEQLRVWFIDKDTYMLPNMEYSQVQPGKNNNKGASYGLVELNHFTPIVESIFLLECVRKLDVDLENQIRLWFSNMLRWVLNSEQWKAVKGSPNNIVSSIFVCLLEMARYADNYEVAISLSNEYTDYVLNVQIDEEGKQPAELKRAAGFGYSVGNTVHIVDFCLIMEQAGVHYYKENQKKIDSAFEYLIQFLGNQDAFPYKQNEGWERYEKKLEYNISRLTRLSSKRSPVTRMAKRKYDTQEAIMDYVYLD